MKLRSLALAALATVSLGAQAGLTTYAPWDNAPIGSGLTGVLFNVQTANGVTVALGAHGYKNGVSLPNNGTDTFYANSGIYPGESAKNYANWSFDFAWDLGTSCKGCVVTLKVDKDPSAGVSFVNLFSTDQVLSSFPGESWNMEMGFMTAGVYDFNPYAPSSTAFRLEVTSGNDLLVGSDIVVNVPEPGSLALLGLGLAGLVALRRRKV